MFDFFTRNLQYGLKLLYYTETEKSQVGDATSLWDLWTIDITTHINDKLLLESNVQIIVSWTVQQQNMVVQLLSYQDILKWAVRKIYCTS